MHGTVLCTRIMRRPVGTHIVPQLSAIYYRNLYEGPSINEYGLCLMDEIVCYQPILVVVNHSANEANRQLAFRNPDLDIQSHK